MPSAPPTPAQPMSRGRILAGGLVGLGIGVLLSALSLFFLFAPWDEPQEVGGVMMPLTMAMPGLAFGIGGLIRFVLGDLDRAGSALAVVWLVIAALGFVVIVAGMVRGTLPWIALAVPPLYIDLMLVRSAMAMRRASINNRKVETGH